MDFISFFDYYSNLYTLPSVFKNYFMPIVLDNYFISENIKMHLIIQL